MEPVMRALLLLALLASCSSKGTAEPDVSDPFTPPERAVPKVLHGIILDPTTGLVRGMIYSEVQQCK